MSDSSTSPTSGQAPPPSSFLGDLLSGKTPGVKSIEAAYSRAGASNNHTPGHASKLGSQEQLPHGSSAQEQGLGSKSFKDGYQDQRVEPSIIGKVFNNMINGTDSTK